MPGPEFFQTGYGRRFYDVHVPQLVSAPGAPVYPPSAAARPAAETVARAPNGRQTPERPFLDHRPKVPK